MLLWHPDVTRAETGEATFLAPFVSVSFLDEVRKEIEAAQVLSEFTSGVYLDDKTRLMWRANDNGKDISWQRALQFCSDLEFAGFDDWRLPSLAELQDLMLPMSNAMYSVPVGINPSACCMWSSTARDDTFAWNFNFRFSKTFSGSKTHTYDLRALCVRDWSEEDRRPEDVARELAEAEALAKAEEEEE